MIHVVCQAIIGAAKSSRLHGIRAVPPHWYTLSTPGSNVNEWQMLHACTRCFDYVVNHQHPADVSSPSQHAHSLQAGMPASCCLLLLALAAACMSSAAAAAASMQQLLTAAGAAAGSASSRELLLARVRICMQLRVDAVLVRI